MRIFGMPYWKPLLRALAGIVLLVPGVSLTPAAAPLAEGAALEGYLTTDDGMVVTSDYGECWHTSSWMPEHAVAGCDPVAVAEPAPAPEPEVVVAAPPPVVVTEQVYFEFDKFRLDDADRETVDRVLANVSEETAIDGITISGHADRIGSEAYNQALSERRAQSARDYVTQHPGVDASNIEVRALGETQPVVDCSDDLLWRDLVECLQPNRRVELELRLK